MSDAVFDAIRRSVAARNSDPARMRRWMENFADITAQGADRKEYNNDAVQHDD